MVKEKAGVWRGVGAKINGRYLIEAELGRGGMGVVYRGRDLILKRPVAVKVVGQSDLGTEGRARLLREAQAAASLNHPNIVAVYDAGQTELPAQDGPSTFVVMELVEGQTLRDYRPGDVAESVAILGQICGALDAAHQQGIIHRDLKAANVALTPSNQVKLMDFGLARTAGRSQLTREGTFMGTFDYLAPELIQGRPASVQSDLYALGVLAYELLAGRRPFASDTPAGVLAQHLHAPLTPPSAYNEAVPPALEQLLVRLLSKRPEDRPASAAAVAQVLVDITATPAGPRAPIPSPQAPIPRPLAPGPRLDYLVRGHLVGREPELAQAMEVWRRAAGGSRQVLLVSGEPGIGKTRLATEIAVQAQLGGARLLQGQCFEHGGLPYMPLAQMIRSVAEEEALAALPQPDLANLARIVPDLSRNWPELEAELDAAREDDESRFLESIVSLCQVLAEERPLLLFFDDLHWADGGTVAAIRHLVRRLAAAPVMFMATYWQIKLVDRALVRTLLEDWRKETGAVQLQLGRLDRQQTETLLTTLLAGEITPDFADAIHAETEGNPFFVEELCKALVESAKLTFVGGQWRRPAMEEIELPQSIQLTVERRLGQLDEQTLEVLRAAALLGREFPYDMLRVAAGLPEAALVDALDAAMRAQLIGEAPARSTAAQGQQMLSFTHALIQAALLSGLSPLRRQLMARRQAQALEEAAGVQSGMALLLGRLYSEAGDGQKAIPYLLEAGDQARRLFAYDDAIGRYEQALRFLRQGDDRDRTARALMTLGATCLKAGQFDRSRRAYDEGFAIWRRKPQAGTGQDERPLATRPFRTHTAEPLTLDPARAIETASKYVLQQIYEGLVELGPDDDLLPAAAASWEIQDGGRRYVFHLRDDAVWSDGQPVTAADFEFAWKRVLAPEVDPRMAYLFFDIRGARSYFEGATPDSSRVAVRAEDALTLVVELEEPVAYFLHLAASEQAFPVPRHLVQQCGDDCLGDIGQIVTNGPFRPLIWERGKRLVLARNARYVGSRGGNLEQVELTFDSGEPVLEAYAAGQMDCLYASLMPADIAAQAISKFGRDILSLPSPITTYLAFDCGRPPFSDRRLRQAISLAIDRRRLAYRRDSSRAYPALTGFIPPGMAGHGLLPEHVADLERARRLLAEAGYPGGKGLPPITFYAASSARNEEATGLFLADELRKTLGLDIRVELFALPGLMQKLEEGKPNLLYLSWSADYTDPDSMLRGGDWPAYCHWSNDAYVKLVNAGRTETNQAKRMKIYRKAEEILAEEAPLVPLLHPRWRILVKPWVRRFAMSPTTWTIFKDVVLDNG